MDENLRAMLIRQAEIWGKGPGDVRIADGRIAQIGSLPPRAGEPVLDARGGALLPGLHDHHIHLAAFAALNASVRCGPPDVESPGALAEALSSRPGSDWLRGVGYHESVAGMLDAKGLDSMAAHRPVRLQHRSGRMWFLNSLALERLLEGAAPPPGLERKERGFTGRLFDEDVWLRRALASAPPSFSEASQTLAAYGVTGVTDMSPSNDPAMAAHFAQEQARSALKQRCCLAGALSLIEGRYTNGLTLGPAKLHLHEAGLPELAAAKRFIEAAHEQGRPAAIHCVTETELVFALAALEEAGPVRGDRIEHASIAPDHLIAEIARLGLWATAQPHFVFERGDQYCSDVERENLPHLYRLRAFLDAGVALGAGSDAPFGGADPWASMSAAVSRKTRKGRKLGAEEALSPEEALKPFLAAPDDFTHERAIEVGAAADLCLLKRSWKECRARLSADDVRASLIGGVIVHDGVDQPPA
jgi:predicted amidohydrolase YtcJ